MKLYLIIAVLILNSCGSDENSSNDRAENPYLTGENSNKYYSGFTQLNGDPFPTNKLPSVLEEGKMIDACKKGQMFHNDVCYDEVHINEVPGFTLIKDDKELKVDGNNLSQSFLDSFYYEYPQHLSAITGRDQKQTMANCDINWFRCPSPSFWGSDIEDSLFVGGMATTISVETVEKIREISIVTKSSFPYFYNRSSNVGGPSEPNIDPNHWNLNGSFTLHGQLLNFPITRRDIKNIIGDSASNRNIPIEYGEITLVYDDKDPKTPDLDDHVLTSITYNMRYSEND